MKRPLSMTAFGRGEVGANRRWIVELRSVNRRFCDIKVKLPREYGALEDKIKKEISALFSRGHIEVMVSVSGGGADGAQAHVNLSLASQYLACLEQLQSTFKLDGQPTLAMLAGCKDVISEEKCEEDLEAVWGEIR